MSQANKDDHETLCDVCSETITIYSVGKCDHPICYKCATRMRVLCDHTYCAICRADLPKVVFTRKFHEFHKLNTSHYPVNRKQKIYFEDGEVQDAYYELLQQSCKLCKQQKFSSFHSLQTHLKREHELFYCELCVKHVKVFSFERKTYSRQDLARHRRIGDADDSSHKGHPLCEFCDERYLDNDELARHLRKDHFYCHFCDADGLHHYYVNYQVLADHFREDHYLCEEGECADLQFTNAFRQKIDYQAHVSQNHGKGMKKSQARQARTLDIEFSLAPRTRERDKGVITGLDYEENQSGGRGRGRGRGRGQRRDHRQDEKDEEALSKALAASQVEFDIHREYKEEVHDFPSLNEAPSLAQSGSSASDTMAKTFARNHNMSVQEGSMASDDFPTLHGGAPTKQYPLHPKQQVWTKSSPQLKKKNTQPARSAGAWGMTASVDDFPVLETTKRHSNQPYSNSQQSMAKMSKPSKHVVKSKAASSEDDYPSLATSNPIQNKIQMAAPVQSKKSKKQNQRPAFSNDNDFPTLGGNTSQKVPTGQSTGYNLASVIGGKKQSLGELAKGISPAGFGKKTLNLKGDADFPTLGGNEVSNETPEWKAVPKKLSKPKKPEAKKVDKKEPASIPGAVFSDAKPVSNKSEKSSETNRNGSGSSTGQKDQKKKKKKNKFEKSEEQLSSLSSQDVESVDLTIQDVNTVTAAPAVGESEQLPLETKDIELSQSNKENIQYPYSDSVGNDTSDEKQRSFLMEDTDFPTLAKQEKKTVTFRLGSSSEEQSPQPEPEKLNFSNFADLKLDMAPLVEDFPSLSSISQSLSKPPPGMAPPGMSKPAKVTVETKRPPGLASTPSPSITTPPPGMPGAPPGMGNFSTLASQLAQKVDYSSYSKPVPPGLGRSANESVMSMQTYQQPNNFTQRNHGLITLLQDCIRGSDDKFKEFKTCSGQFRQKNITAEQYYIKCRDILGEVAFTTIFPELLVLLPDIAKQQELLTVHSQWSLVKDEFETCPLCRQVLAEQDYSQHVTCHRLDEFPSLGAGDITTQNFKRAMKGN